MKTFKIPSEVAGDKENTNSNIRIYGDNKFRIRYPHFSFIPPQEVPQRKTFSKSLEGKWTGTVVSHEATYEEKDFVHYNPEIDYKELFSLFGYEDTGGENDIISARTLRKWDWFGNKCIIAYESLNVYEIKLEITAENSNDFRVSSRVHFKSIECDNFYAKYEKNHEVMNKFQPESLEKRREIDRRLVGTEYPGGEDCIVSETNGSYIPINADHLKAKIGVKDPLGIVPTSPERDAYAMSIDNKEGLAIQQLANDTIVMHSSSYYVNDLIRPDLINVRTIGSVNQNRFDLRRVNERPTTHITVGGDYVEKKVDISDSVINRSEI